MIWLILILLLVLFVLPKMGLNLFGKKTEQTQALQAATVDAQGATQPSATVVTSQPKVGPFAQLLGNSVGTIAQTAVGTVIAMPRNLLSSLGGMIKRH